MAVGRTIRLNTDTGFLKLIAMTTMLIDHVGAVFYPQYPILRVIGRISFPLYAYCLAVGCVYTKNPLRYALRILLLALISQPVYCLGLRHISPAMTAAVANGITFKGALVWYWESLKMANILFSLLLGLVLLIGIREKKYILSGVCVLAACLLSNHLSYGLRGILLMVLFYAFLDRPLTSFVWVLGYMLWWGISDGGGYSLFGVSFSSQTFAALALVLIYIPTKTGIRCGKWLSYLFYPAHLAALYGVACLLS